MLAKKPTTTFLHYNKMMFLKPKFTLILSLTAIASLLMQIMAENPLAERAHEVIEGTTHGLHNLHQTFFEKFSESDLKEFLKDHNISIYEGNFDHTNAESLRKYCSEKWHDLVSPEGYENTNYTSWFIYLKNLVLPKSKNKHHEIIDELKDKVTAALEKNKKEVDSNDISQWLFTSWDVPALKSFLKENKIFVSQELKSKDALIQICKDHFEQLNDYLKSSGYYVSDKYFSKWTRKDMSNWLKKYKIQYTPDSSLEDLRMVVRKNIYKVSNSLKEAKNNLLRNLDIDDFGGFLLEKTSPNEKIEVLKSHLSKPDLVKWLKLHDINLKNLDMNDDKKFYSTFKETNIMNLLTNDIKSYMEFKKDEAEKKVGPLIGKSSKQIEDQYKSYKNTLDNAAKEYSNAIADLSSWSARNLNIFEEHFMQDSGIAKKKLHKDKKAILKYMKNLGAEQKDNFLKSYKAFQKELLPLLKETGESKVDTVNSFFESWSSENLKKWLNENANVDDISESLIDKAKQKITGNTGIKEMWEQISESWSKDDFLGFLKNLGSKSLVNEASLPAKNNLMSMSKEELYELCKKNSLWLLSGGDDKKLPEKTYFERVTDQFVLLKDRVPYLRDV